MCGITGIIHLDGQGSVNSSLLREMTALMRHRGPDDEGFYEAPGVGLGHRRLSIIDLDTGRQPMGNEDGSIQVVFNGEIYNFLDLRCLLQDKGHMVSQSGEDLGAAFERDYRLFSAYLDFVDAGTMAPCFC